MSVLKFDVKMQFPNSEPFSYQRIVASGSVGSINAGEPTKQGSAGAVVPMADADGTTSQIFTGIAKSVSSDTATAAGVVTLYLPFPGIVYACAAKTATLANTQALINSLQGKRVVWDLTAAVYTIDTAAADNAANGIVIIGGEYQTSTIWFITKSSTTLFGE